MSGDTKVLNKMSNDAMQSFQVAGKQGHSTTVLGQTISADSLPALTTLYEPRRIAASLAAGLPPGQLVTHKQMREGIPKPAMTADERKEANRKRAYQQYLDQQAAAPPSPEQARLKAAESRVNEARRSKLSHIERELEDAQKSAHEAEQRAADESRREATRQSAGYQSTHQKLVDLTFAASFDPSVSQGQLSALQAELTSLESTQDISTVRANLREIQTAIAQKLEVEDNQLKAASDAIAARKAALGQGC